MKDLSLLNEKILQYYFYQLFISCTPNKRKKLLPEQYIKYSDDTNFKGLIPEKTYAPKIERVDHNADFILCPTLKSNLEILNIELKWNKKDFEKQSSRFKFYDGTIAKGYVVDVNDNPTNEDDYILDTKIPVIHLNSENFRHWFIVNAKIILDSTLNKKKVLNNLIIRKEKFWIISLSNSAYINYLEKGFPKKIWSFSDSVNSKNISNILQGDYIIFVKIHNITPKRQVYPYNNNPNHEYGTGRSDRPYTKSEVINWDIVKIDILKVSTGWHINYSNKPPYNIFEDTSINSNADLNSKKYTQFIKFNYNQDDTFQFISSDTLKLNRKLFNFDNIEECSIVDSMRESLSKQGDAREITYDAFLKLHQILSSNT